MRLQKYMALCGVASRRASERMIAEGCVAVNGAVVTAMGTQVEEGDSVTVNGAAIAPVAQHSYCLYYKPMGEISTASDPEGRRTVVDRFKGLGKRLFPVGRLDWDTQGLIIMTDDGALMQGLTHPSRGVMKTYLARIDALPGDSDLEALRRGVTLEDGSVCAPVQDVSVRALPAGGAEIRLILHEGKNRQVRRMMDAIGRRTIRLTRAGFAFLTLEGLSPGKYRELTPEEVEALRTLAGVQNT